MKSVGLCREKLVKIEVRKIGTYLVRSINSFTIIQLEILHSNGPNHRKVFRIYLRKRNQYNYRHIYQCLRIISPFFLKKICDPMFFVCRHFLSPLLRRFMQSIKLSAKIDITRSGSTYLGASLTMPLIFAK